jgi:acetyltransferase-like isoleucine patch superfamily enzyme
MFSSMIQIHATADVAPSAFVGEETRIWHQAQVREGAQVGRNCILGKGVYVDHDVRIGDRCKLQNGASIFSGVTLEDGVFVGPGAILTNDRKPRAINPDGSLKSDDDWQVGSIWVRQGASLGAGCIVLPDVTIGRFAMVGAGAIVTRDVPDQGLVTGNPARLVGYVCVCGHSLGPKRDSTKPQELQCWHCSRTFIQPSGGGAS